MKRCPALLSLLPLALGLCAITLLAAGRAGAAPPSPTTGVSVTWEGRLDLEAHFSRPGETRPFHSRQRYLTDGRSAVRLDWWTRAWDDTAAGEPETWLLAGGTVWHRDAPDAGWEKLSGERAELGRFQLFMGAPDLPGLAALAAPGTDSGRKRAVSVGGGDRPAGSSAEVITEAHPHPRLGDVTDRVVRIRRHAGRDAVAPDSLDATLFERDQNWTLRAARVEAHENVPLDSLLTAPTVFTVPPVEPELPTTPPEFMEITSGVWLASMEDLDTRSLVVEFTDYLAVVEFAIGSPNGERLVDGIKARWPNKPIRYALFSHYHPHYLGGVRALVAEGATVVTTPGNAALVRQMCAAPFTLRPDRLARGPRPLALQTFTGRFELKDASNQLVAIDIGARSTHTDEFVIFWLPKGLTLFETEQGWFGRDGVQRAGRRAANLLKVMQDENLPAQRIVQSWPMRGTAPQMLRATFEKLVDERARALK